MYSLDGKCKSFCIGLSSVQNPDHFPVLIENRASAISPVGCNIDLAAQGITFKAGLCAEIAFAIYDLVSWKP